MLVVEKQRQASYNGRFLPTLFSRLFLHALTRSLSEEIGSECIWVSWTTWSIWASSAWRFSSISEVLRYCPSQAFRIIASMPRWFVCMLGKINTPSLSTESSGLIPCSTWKRSEPIANISVASDRFGEGPLTGSGRSEMTRFDWPKGLAALKSQRIAEPRLSKSTLSIRTSPWAIPSLWRWQRASAISRYHRIRVGCAGISPSGNGWYLRRNIPSAWSVSIASMIWGCGHCWSIRKINRSSCNKLEWKMVSEA